MDDEESLQNAPPNSNRHDRAQLDHGPRGRPRRYAAVEGPRHAGRGRVRLAAVCPAGQHHLCGPIQIQQRQAVTAPHGHLPAWTRRPSKCDRPGDGTALPAGRSGLQAGTLQLPGRPPWPKHNYGQTSPGWRLETSLSHSPALTRPRSCGTGRRSSAHERCGSDRSSAGSRPPPPQVSFDRAEGVDRSPAAMLERPHPWSGRYGARSRAQGAPPAGRGWCRAATR